MTESNGIDDSTKSLDNQRTLGLLNRDFLLLWQGQTISGIGVSLYQIAMLYWLLENTGSATTMGLVAMFSALPGVLLGPFGGAIADRFSRRKLIVFGDLILGITLLSVGITFLLVDGSTDLKVGLMIAAGVIVGIVGSFFRPAVTAAIPNLVPIEKLASANAMNSFSMTGSMALGQAIGGVLFRIVGAPILIFVNVITYLLSALSEVFIRLPQELPVTPPSWRSLARQFNHEVVEGIRYVWTHRGLRNMALAFAVISFITAPLSILMPILLDQHRNLPPDWFGYLMAAMAVGNLFGLALAGSIKIDGSSRAIWILISLYAMATTTFLMGTAEKSYILLIANAVSGFFMGGTTVLFTTLMQATTPDGLRGRVASVMSTVIGGTTPIAMGLSGVLADAVDQDVPFLFQSASVFCFIFVSMLIANRPFREFLSTQLVVNNRGKTGKETGRIRSSNE